MGGGGGIGGLRILASPKCPPAPVRLQVEREGRRRHWAAARSGLNMKGKIQISIFSRY